MSRLVPVKDYPNLARDSLTGAIVNINKKKHREHIANKKRDEEINNIHFEIKEIRSMLHQLLENGRNDK